MSQGSLAFLLAASLCVFLPGAPALAQDGARPPSLLRNDTFGLEAALQRVAAAFFGHGAKGQLAEVERLQRVELHSRGVEYERYRVNLQGRPAGEFTRVKTVGASSVTLDVAVRLDGEGALRAVLPLRTPVVEGRPVPELPNMFQPLLGRRPAAFAAPLGALFRALLFVGRAAEQRTPGGPPLTPAVAQAIFDALPKPVSTCPDRPLTGLDGSTLTRATLAGKPLLMVFASVDHPQSVDALRVVTRLALPNKARLALVTVLTDGAPTAERWLARAGGAWFGHVVVDAREEHKAAFSIPTVPYVLGFDGAGAQKLAALHRGPAETTTAVLDYLGAVLGKAFARPATPAPTSAPDPAEREALERAAGLLFPVRPGDPPLTLEQTLELTTEGLRFENWARRRPGASDEFTRVLAEVDAARTVDVALTVARGCVLSAVPVRPLPMGQKPLEDLAPLFAPFAGLDAELYGPAVGSLLDALEHLDRVAPGKLPAPLATERAGGPRNTLQVTQPLPVLSEPCPDLVGTTLDGKPAGRALFPSQPFLVLVGSLRDAMTLELERVVHEFLDGVQPTAPGLLTIYGDSPQALADRLRQGWRPRGAVVADRARENQARLKAPYAPYVFGYLSDGTLGWCSPYLGLLETRKGLASFLEKSRAAGTTGKDGGR